MSGRRQTHLIRRGAVFYGRFPVPFDLLNRVQKSELTWSLHERFACRAKRKVVRWTGDVQRLFAYIRRMTELTQDDIRKLIREFHAALADGQPIEAILPAEDEDDPVNSVAYQEDAADQEIARLKALRGVRPFDRRVENKVITFLESRGIEFDHLSAAQQGALIEGAIRALIEDERRIVHQLRTHLDPYMPTDDFFHDVRGVAQGTPARAFETAKAPQLTLGKAVADYNKERKHADVRAQTLEEQRRTLKWFVDFLGEDRPLASLARDDIKAFREALRTIRKRASSTLPFEDLIDAPEKKRPSTKTLHKMSRHVAMFLDDAAEQRLLESMPAKTITIGISRADRRSTKRGFTSDEIQSVLKQPIFDRPLSRKPYRKIRGRRPTEFGWFVLLAMYTGARSGELMQLNAEGVRIDDDVPHIRIRGELKNDNSEREVPIHPELIELGFLDFCREKFRKQKNKGRLFSEIPKGKARGYTQVTSKWGRHLLNSSGLNSPELSLHSFRHTMAQHLRDAGQPNERAEEITGHKSPQRSSFAEYGGPADLKRKLETLRSISFRSELLASGAMLSDGKEID